MANDSAEQTLAEQRAEYIIRALAEVGVDAQGMVYGDADGIVWLTPPMGMTNGEEVWRACVLANHAQGREMPCRACWMMGAGESCAALALDPPLHCGGVSEYE